MALLSWQDRINLQFEKHSNFPRLLLASVGVVWTYKVRMLPVEPLWVCEVHIFVGDSGS